MVDIYDSLMLAPPITLAWNCAHSGMPIAMIAMIEMIEMAMFTLGVNKRLNTSVLTSMNYQHSQRSAENEAYEVKNDLLNLGLEYRLSSKSTLYADLQFSVGDQTSGAAGNNIIISAKIETSDFVVDTIYGCSTQCSYSACHLDADGITTTIGFAYSLTQNISLDLSTHIYDWDGDAGIGSSDWSASGGLI
ncbi:MAG: hypothetical protein ACJA2O_001928 [Candidatus Azotimanducaceae bacterium]